MTNPAKPIVLIVEDEGLIRVLAVEAFLDAGFCVIEAEDSSAALLVYNCEGPLQLLFTDVNMPGDLDGVELAQRLGGLIPGLKIIITSALPVRPLDHLTATFVAKPYSLASVTAAGRELLAA